MNCLISILKSNYEQDVFNILSKNVDNIFPNPVGGWAEWGYDVDYFWDIFLQTRKIIPKFTELTKSNKYVEIGFSTIPFVKNSEWLKVGLTEHPATWIQKAYNGKFHASPGDGMNWKPANLLHYAKLWCQLTSKININCDYVYRTEDVLIKPNILLNHFNKSTDTTGKTSTIPPIPDDIWMTIEKHAKCVGYDRTGCSQNSTKDSNIAYDSNVNAVSIIIAARNNGEYLEEALSSAINQSVSPLEVIYVDDGSTDNSLEVAKKFKNIKITQQKHQGICSARNNGAQIALGEYLLYLDGDDILPNQYLKNRLDVLKSNTNASFVYGSAQGFGDCNYLWEAQEWDKLQIWNSNFINVSTLIKKEHLLSAGMWRESIGSSEDWDLWLRMIKLGYYGACDSKSFLLYRQHNKSRRTRDNTKENQIETNRLKFLMRNAHSRAQISAVISETDSIHDWLSNVIKNVEFYKNKLLSEKTYSEFGEIIYLKPDISIIYVGDDENHIKIELDKTQVFNKITLTHKKKEGKIKFYKDLLKTENEIIWFIDDRIVLKENIMYDSIYELFSHNTVNACVSGLNEIKSLKIDQDFVDIIIDHGSLMIFKPYAEPLCDPSFDAPVVSVIVPAWNEGTRVKKCLDSIRNQDFKNFEVIMVNDGSTDDTESVMLKYAEIDKRFKYFENLDNRGTGFTVNYGMSNCVGKYITWFSADSWMYPTFISKLKSALDENPDKVLAYSNWDAVNEDGDMINTTYVPEYDKKLLQIYSFVGCCCLYRKKAKDAAGNFCENICEDYYMYLMLSSVGDFIKVNDTLGCWRNHKDNLTNRVSIPTKWYMSSVAKAKARQKQTKYKIAYLCPTIDAASVGWLLMNVFNDLSDNFSVRHIMGDKTHMMPGQDLMIHTKHDNAFLDKETVQVLREADIIHVNNDFPDFDQDVLSLIKNKPIIIHFHAGPNQWNVKRIKYWSERAKLLSCVPGHLEFEWIPNFIPITNGKTKITYEEYYTPKIRNNNKLKMICHHNYKAGKGILQLEWAISEWNRYIWSGKLDDVMDWSINGSPNYELLDHLLFKKDIDVVIDSIPICYLGMCAFESMSQGSAVIGRMDEITQREYIRVFGSIPPVLNIRIIDDILNHLTAIIENKDMAKEFGNTGRKWMLENYNAEKMLGLYEKIYYDVLK